MATRLYPSTTDDRNLEILAGVPEGTTLELAKIKAMEKTMNAYAWHDLLYKNEHAHALHSFKIFGWGRMQTDLSYSGSTNDAKEVTQILTSQGIIPTPEVLKCCEGLHWS
jgi:hypothetical protein